MQIPARVKAGQVDGEISEITQYRVKKSIKRFRNLSFPEWSDLRIELQMVHPRYDVYWMELQRLELQREAKRKHIEELLAVVGRLKADLVMDVGDSVLVQESLVPLKFVARDGAVEWHDDKLPAVWLVERTGDVKVSFSIERRDPLFPAMTEHLPPEIVEIYEAIKGKIASAIKRAIEKPSADIVVRDFPNLIFKLAEELDSILSSRMLDGSCRTICARINALGAPVPNASSEVNEKAA